MSSKQTVYTINGIEYPAELGPDALELHELTHAYLSCLMENGTPGETHADLLGEYYSTLPQRLKRVMAHQIAYRERAAWEAEHLGLNGDYVDLGNGRVVKADEYDPEKHGPKVEV